MERAAALVATWGFDGIDINMGCPDRSVERRGAGAALSRTPGLAQAIIRAAQRGASELPVSVKIRLGYAHNDLATWLPALFDAAPAVITIHARTRQEMSKVPAHWEALAQAAAIRERYGSATYLIGNGDVVDLADARQKARRSGVEGIMLGRAALGNPWLFHPHAPRSVAERLDVMLEHTRLFTALLSDRHSFAVMKKHYKAYVTGFPGSRGLFLQLMETHCGADVEAIVRAFLSQYAGEEGLVRPAEVL
jgi:tRNA-dihydrouridine synthase